MTLYQLLYYRMTNIITIIVLVSSIGFVLVCGECKTNGPPIKSCCCLGYNNTFFNVKSSGVYATMAHFCETNCSMTRVYCDTTSGGGGWLVIQRRDKQYSTSFHRSWTEYADGFGDLYKEFWLGLRGMHCLTGNGNWELRIDFTFSNGTKSYMHYSHFSVGPANDNYRLNISGFTGTTPDDPFTTYPLNGQQFSTYDRDNDGAGYRNCALDGHGDETGGWWHNDCFWINLNFKYGGGFGGFIRLANTWHSPSFIEMKTRPANCEIY